MISRRSVLAALGSVAVCLSMPAATRAQTPKLKAVASFSILADLVHQIGGDRVEVTSLVGPDGDAHVFSPTPADATKVANARVVFVNGLGLEGWIGRLVKSSGSKAPVVTASAGVKAIKGEGEEHGHGKKEHGNSDHDHGDLDPHAWQDVQNAKIYVANIRDGLIKADPDGKDAYESNASAYLAQLDALDAEVKASIGAIPKDRRKIITTHDAFGYFGRAYGMDFLAPQGVSTDSEASAADVAKIIRQIKTARIPAVFLENISDPRLIERIAKESGAAIGGRVYSDALSDAGGPAGTYVDMIRNNVKAFREALSR
jgi:zinc/manganese transport system substrate-binding protein